MQSKKQKNMPILTIKVLPSFTTPWYGHEETKNTVLSVHQMPMALFIIHYSVSLHVGSNTEYNADKGMIRQTQCISFS